jgi:hypothetical protein
VCSQHAHAFVCLHPSTAISNALKLAVSPYHRSRTGPTSPLRARFRTKLKQPSSAPLRFSLHSRVRRTHQRLTF